MSAINLSVKHNTTQQEARGRLEGAVNDLWSRFGNMIEKTEWTPDRNTVKVAGKGFTGEMWVDHESVYLTADIPLLAGLLGSPIVKSLKSALEQNFQKRIT